MRQIWLVLVAVVGGACSAASPHLTKAELGHLAFADRALSQPAGQSCSDCHAENRVFTDPEADHATSAGAVTGRFGPRNAPTAMYARYIPPLHVDPATHEYLGGLFWDGRASSFEDQANGPLANPLEMNNPDKAAIVAAVRKGRYAAAFRAIYGASSLDDPERAFSNLLDAIAAYERAPDLAPFSSKYDRYLAGKATLTAREQHGLAVFEDPARGNCASCHPSRPAANGTPPLFTTFTYANLGIPTYRNSGFLVQQPGLNPDGTAFVDHGLMKTTGDPHQDGKFRVPTLRNVARSGPYGHNGYFENLQYLISFLNTRDTGSPVTGRWAPPEIAVNVDSTVGHLGLTKQEIDDVVVFLATLNDTPARR